MWVGYRPRRPGGLVDWWSPPGLGVEEAAATISAASHRRLRDSQGGALLNPAGPLPSPTS